MSQVELVALWAGLLSSVVGIVLSVVALVFTWVVNRRSERISDHTIQSLQKIESTVANLSESTTGLIKAAWDKMLGSFGSVDDSRRVGHAREAAAGVAAEIRQELADEASGKPATSAKDKVDRVETVLAQLEHLLPSRRSAFSDGSLLEYVLSELRTRSPEARELFSALKFRHLTKKQYDSLA